MLFAEDKEEQTFFAGGKELSAKLIADAIHNLPEEKRRAVLLYYFFGNLLTVNRYFHLLLPLIIPALALSRL